MDNWAIAATVFASLSVTLSFYAILGHLNNFTKPYLQRYIIRILFMVPIYSMNAWIAMLIPVAGLYLDSMREVYESFVIYSFMKYLLNFLNYDTNLEHYIDQKLGPNQLFPLCLFPSCSGGRLFMIRCKHGILQYVVVRPITTLIAFTSQEFGFYGEGNYNPFSGYTYPVLLIVNNLSQILAMYCLVIFYTGYRSELHPMQPLLKFFSIKLVVFFSFFQSVLISGIMEIPVVEEMLRELFPELQDKIQISRKLQEFLICIDMFIAAIGHQFAFSHKPFIGIVDGFSDINSCQAFDNESSTLTGRQSSVSTTGTTSNQQNSTCCEAICNLFDFEDERGDISEHFGHIFGRIRKVFTFNKKLTISESQRNLSEVIDNNTKGGDSGSQLDDQFMSSRPNSAYTPDLLASVSPEQSNKYMSLN